MYMNNYVTANKNVTGKSQDFSYCILNTETLTCPEETDNPKEFLKRNKKALM